MSERRRREWVCGECGCTFRRIDGEPFRPEGWAGDRCKRCALESETGDETARRLLLEGCGVERVFRGCGLKADGSKVTKPEIKAMREELIESGELDPDLKPTGDTRMRKKQLPPREARREPRPPDPKAVEAEALLREEPRLENREVADRLGWDYKKVGKVRRSAGVPEAAKAKRAALRDLLETSPGLSNGDVQAALSPFSLSPPVIREVRRELGISRAA